jgi:hypothetical protein
MLVTLSRMGLRVFRLQIYDSLAVDKQRNKYSLTLLLSERGTLTAWELEKQPFTSVNGGCPTRLPRAGTLASKRGRELDFQQPADWISVNLRSSCRSPFVL